jgi:hypothetical protein
MDMLARSQQCGYLKEELLTDPDLDALRVLPEFSQLSERVVSKQQRSV